MSDRCDYTQRDGDITGYRLAEPDDGLDCLQCLRKEGHSGPHLVLQAAPWTQEYVLWQKIICDDCDYDCLFSLDWEDCCIVHTKISPEEAAHYIEDSEYER